MLNVQLVVVATFFVALAVSDQGQRITQFGHNGVGYRVIETVEPIAVVDHSRSKRETSGTTTSNTTTQSSILECYQFTWPGTTENNTVPDCTKLKNYAPCFKPFVFTNDSSYPEPDPAVVKDYCASKGCKVTCQKTSANSCVRYAYYSAGQAVNVTYFCGAIQDTTDDIPLKEGVVSETKSGGLVVHVKFCQGDYCNSANFKHVPFFMIFVSIATLLFLW